MPETGRPRGDLMQFADLGLRLALTVALFTYAGYRLDAWLSTGPWLLIALALSGVAAGMYSVIRGVGRWQRGAPARPGAAAGAGSPAQLGSPGQRPTRVPIDAPESPGADAPTSAGEPGGRDDEGG